MSLVAGSLAGMLGRGPLRAPGSSPHSPAPHSSRFSAPHKRTSSYFCVCEPLQCMQTLETSHKTRETRETTAGLTVK